LSWLDGKGGLVGRTGIDAPDVQDNHPRNHEDDPTSHNKGINSEKKCIHDGFGFGRGLGEKKVKNGFPEQNKHDGNADGRPEKIQFGIA
jgi:hypothetical protein